MELMGVLPQADSVEVAAREQRAIRDGKRNVVSEVVRRQARQRVHELAHASGHGAEGRNESRGPGGNAVGVRDGDVRRAVPDARNIHGDGDDDAGDRRRKRMGVRPGWVGDVNDRILITAASARHGDAPDRSRAEGRQRAERPVRGTEIVGRCQGASRTGRSRSHCRRPGQPRGQRAVPGVRRIQSGELLGHADRLIAQALPRGLFLGPGRATALLGLVGWSGIPLCVDALLGSPEKSPNHQ